MHVIDLEIMIHASPDFIWRFLGDIASSADWQAGVTAVSFLTTQHEGKGARWRYSYARGSDVIVEAAAWYDTLGYEYSIVDGAGYGNNQGRIRLQEVNDGTLVRWTFNYEAGGMLGGLRNAMRLKRNTTRQIQDSLRNLNNLVQKESGGISTHSARATVREAPGADERSSYQPRHPSNFVEPASEVADEDGLPEDLQPIAFTLEEEPSPVGGQSDGDTKPNPVVLGGDGLLDMVLQKNEIEAATEPIDAEVVSIKPGIREEIAEEPLVPEVPQVPEEPVEAIPIDRRPVPTRVQRGAVDTSTLSVFEIFGLPKPSEAGDAQPAGMDRSSAERGDGILRERVRDLSLLFDEEGALPPDQPEDLGSGYNSASSAAVEAASIQAAQVTGMRRSTRRLSRPLRSHN
ncbi:MAG: SRPBCC family protein [Chloroflexi bacterium]|nr:SRPBCC family protein [Chloroflexota bacterium]